MTLLDTALLVIDAQELFRHRPYWTEDELPRFINRTQALVDGARLAGIPVVQIFHVEDDGPFAVMSDNVTTLEPLRIVPDVVFHKRRHSAFVGSGLHVWLTQHGIRRLIVSGIRTEQCCETTTRNASDFGYDVDYVTEATLTFPMHDASGQIWTPDDIKARTELVLAGRFARIATVEQALDALKVEEAA